MWEISLSIDKQHHHLLESVMSKLAGALKDAIGVVTLDENALRSHLTLACEENSRKDISRILEEEIINIYVDAFKQMYLEKNARLPKTNQLNYNAFIRALVAFDSEFDRELVQKRLTLTDGLMLDGFFNFRLKELKARWKEVCDLANDNACYLSYQDTFLELMRFLINTIESKADEIIIEQADSGYKILNCESFEVVTASQETLLSSIINLSPNIINVYEGTLPENLYYIIESLFDKRLKTIYTV